ncbi:MAG: hypothetical protein ACJA2W_004026, partial [Planctomycetota bacterium]
AKASGEDSGERESEKPNYELLATGDGVHAPTIA